LRRHCFLFIIQIGSQPKWAFYCPRLGN
jgi:hypothetical protein